MDIKKKKRVFHFNNGEFCNGVYNIWNDGSWW